LPTMKAAVVHQPGGPERLQIKSIPVPEAAPGQVLIRVKAFGLNRSELFTRQGHSPGVQFPRVLGIEAVGLVEHAPAGEFQVGQMVATVMGGMGRDFDGGYAEYTCVPSSQVQAIHSDLPWNVLGAWPEMLQTAWGSLFTALQLQKGERLLIRGSTTSIGLAAAAIAKNHGATVCSTTRNPERTAMLRASGVERVFVDDGRIQEHVRTVYPDGVDKVLELVGTGTLQDSLGCVKPKGTVCMSGIVGNQWTWNVNPMEAIPSAVRLTTYSGTVQDFMKTPVDDLLQQIALGTLKVPLGPTFRLDDIVEAHRCMEENRAGGKIVVVV
jgi:NADPH:quinone reductase-like Zn-dependent oxidoreductase